MVPERARILRLDDSRCCAGNGDCGTVYLFDKESLVTCHCLWVLPYGW